jgi:hypothetical protein
MSIVRTNLVEPATITATGSPYGKIINFRHYNTGIGVNARTTTNSTSWVTMNIGGTSLTGLRQSGNNNVVRFDKRVAGSNLIIKVSFPFYINGGADAGAGIRCQGSVNGSTFGLIDIVDTGPAHQWGAAGYGGEVSKIVNYVWSTKDNASMGNQINNAVGNVFFFWQVISWNASNIMEWNSRDPHDKFGSIQILELTEGF